MATDVIGRGDELASIGAFLEQAEVRPAGLVLAGEPGIGKTILWESGVEQARRGQANVLWCRCVESEASLSFGGLSDLLGGVFEEVEPVLAPPRRRVLELALLLAEPGDEPVDLRAIALALLDVLHALAERSPVVVAVDDVQWLDASTAMALQMALRRLRVERVGFLATLREAAETRLLLDLGRLLPEEQLTQISLSPLSVGALHHLLRERLGIVLTRPELVRLKAATAGNPFYALELGRELARLGARPAAGQGLRVPESLRELLGARLARLPQETSDVLLHAAALARPTLELVATAHGDREGVFEAFETALQQGVVELDDSRVRFAHPLLASVCYQRAPLWRRRAVHLALASAVMDVEEQARHLALASDGPDAAVASALDGATREAAARGATASAAELSELAAELTPADPVLIRKRRLRAADLHRLAGDTERAKEMLDQLLTDVPDGFERADVLILASMLKAETPEALIEQCSEALVAANGDDHRSARILALRAWASRISGGDISAAAADARTALEMAERVGDPVLIADAIAQVGGVETWTGEVTPGLLERGAEIEERLEHPLEHRQSPRVALARRLKRQGELDRARTILQELEEEAAARGDEGTRSHLLWRLSTLEWFAGRWPRALELATEAHELGEQAQLPGFRVIAGSLRVLIEADLGLVEQARASAHEALAIAHATSNEVFVSLCHGALGHLELALGNLEAAGGYLRGVSEELLPGRLNDPTGRVWSDAIETMIGLGELDEARAIIEWQELQAEHLGSRWARALAAHGRGVLDAAEGDLDAAFAAFEPALEELERLPYPFDRGRTLLGLGMTYRKAKQKRAARESLEGALAVFEELGARLWAEKARSELGRISGRAPSAGGLTPTERRVASLAAQGLANKEIAAALFLSVHTVEWHLTHVYRKLGLHSRAELAHRLNRAAEEATKP